MAEKLTLSIPEIKPSITDYQIALLELSWKDKVIRITLTGTNGEHKTFEYREIQAANLMITLNKANLSVKSLHRRILEKLVSDGFLIGTVIGLPD